MDPVYALGNVLIGLVLAAFSVTSLCILIGIDREERHEEAD